MNDRDSIRKRPGMYIGDTSDGSGLHNMVYEVVANALNEALAGFGKNIEVILNIDGSCTVRDHGRGIPVEIHPTQRISVAQIILTDLLSVRLYPTAANDTKQFPGVGLAVVNALSDRLELRIWRNGQEYMQHYQDGLPEAPVAPVGPAVGKTGTQITFTPSPDIFAVHIFDFATLENHLREQARSKPDVIIALTDQRTSPHNRAIVVI